MFVKNIANVRKHQLGSKLSDLFGLSQILGFMIWSCGGNVTHYFQNITIKVDECSFNRLSIVL